MENNTQPPIGTPTPPQTPVEPTVSPYKSNLLVISLVIIEVITLLIAGYFAYQSSQLKKQLTTQPAPTPISNSVLPTTNPITSRLVSPTPDVTAKWKSYSSNEAGYSITYPPNWTITPMTGGKPGEIRISQINDASSIQGEVSIFPYNGQEVTVPVKTWIENQQKQYDKDCGNGGCGGGSPYKFIKEALVNGLTATKAFYNAPGPLSGFYITYFIPTNKTVFEIQLESSEETENFDEGNTPTAKMFQKILQSLNLKLVQ
jgi:hypothetical protein